MKRIKHRAKMRRRIKNHSTYSTTIIVEWYQDLSFTNLKWLKVHYFGKTKGREIK